MLNSPLCIGGYSALLAAKLLSLGIMQAGLPFALAESQFCLWSLSCMFSFIVLLYLVQIHIDDIMYDYNKKRDKSRFLLFNLDNAF